MCVCVHIYVIILLAREKLTTEEGDAQYWSQTLVVTTHYAF